MAEIGIKCRWFNATAVNVLCVYEGLPSGRLSASNPVVYQSWVFLLLLESHMFVVGEEAERSLQRSRGLAGPPGTRGLLAALRFCSRAV